MRTAFAQTLLEMAAADPRIYLLIGDVGFGVFEPFQRAFPERFINVGVAEANLAGIAAGLGLSGKIPYIYSIANFPTLRCLEQIRNDICYNGANVKIVSVGGGLAYGALGATHHATQDVAILRALPNMIVIAPADPIETALATRAACLTPAPVYLRLNRAGDPLLHGREPAFQIGKAISLRDGQDATLIACGGITQNVLLAADELANIGIHCSVLSMHTIKPIDVEAIVEASRSTGFLVTIEEHSIVGGLGGAVAEVLADTRQTCQLLRLGLPDSFPPLIGSQEFLRAAHSLDPHGIVEAVLTRLRGNDDPISSFSANDLHSVGIA